jgi:hypothetical protein
MSYTPFVFFGYEIQLSPDRSESIQTLCELNGMSPFEIRCLLPSFYPLMNEEDYARVVIGFIPDQIEDLVDHAADLESFLEDTPLFEGFEVAQLPQFHCGIEWYPDFDSSSDTSSGSSSDSASDSSDA